VPKSTVDRRSYHDVQMPPRRTRRARTPDTEEPVNTTIRSMNQADLAKLITDQVAAAIPTIAAHLNVDSNNNRNGGGDASEFTGGTGTGSSYKSFISCQPPKFKGTEVATKVI
jgi:hypothetical protein